MQGKKLVKIKELKDIDVNQHPRFFVEKMGRFCGTIIQVSFLAHNYDGEGMYNGSGYLWNEEWFEEISTPLSNILYK